MQFKSGVNYVGLQIHIRRVLKHADEIWRRLGQELVVTSALDGTHSAGSLHYYGYAVDLRSRYFSDAEKAEAVKLLKTALAQYSGRRYRVIVHDTHIHVQYVPNVGGVDG